MPSNVDLTLESLKLTENWPVGDKVTGLPCCHLTRDIIFPPNTADGPVPQDDSMPSSRAFDDFDEDDEDETYHHLDYNVPTHDATNVSPSAYAHHDSYSSSDDDDDEGREIGDQFADFGSSAFSDTFSGNTDDFADFPDISAEGQRPFEANFDVAGASATAAASFEATFEPTFDANFEATFDAPNQAGGDDFFAAFPTSASEPASTDGASASKLMLAPHVAFISLH